MDTTLLIVVLIAIVLSAHWLRSQLIGHRGLRFETLVYLSLHSRETEDVLGTKIPRSITHLYKVVSLKTLPAPGVELDGLGTGPLKIARAVIDDGAKYDAFVQLTPLVVAAEEIEPYVTNLVADLGWKRLLISPPYPAGGA